MPTEHYMFFSVKERWSEKDTEVIRITFKKEIETDICPKRPTIRQLFITKLPRIWNRSLEVDWQNRCIEKLRTEWRKANP